MEACVERTQRVITQKNVFTGEPLVTRQLLKKLPESLFNTSRSASY